MLKYILPYETHLFFLINGTHSYWSDCFLWLYSKFVIWIPLVILLLFVVTYKKKWTEWLPVLIAIAVLITCCDQFSSHLIKQLFARPRPTHYPGIMNYVRTLYGYSGGHYGFISGHATNCFGFAIFTALLFRNKTYNCVVFSWVTIMIYSRVYIGVHFVSDVVFGALSGIVIGVIIYQLYHLLMNKIHQKWGIDVIAVYENNQIRITSLIIAIYIVFFAMLCELLIKIL